MDETIMDEPAEVRQVERDCWGWLDDACWEDVLELWIDYGGEA